MDSSIILQGRRCPFCGDDFVNFPPNQIADHIIACAREKVGLIHPEVADEEDTTITLQGDDPDVEDSEAPPDHHSRR